MLPRFCSSFALTSTIVLLSFWWSEFASSHSIGGLKETALEPVDYSGYKVFRIHPETELQRASLRRYYDEASDKGVTLWSEPRVLDQSMDLLVDKRSLRAFLLQMHRFKISHEILIEDLQRLIDDQRRESDESRRQEEEEEKEIIRARRSVPGTDAALAVAGDRERSIFFGNITNRYPNSTEINNWLRLVTRIYPNISEVIQIGRSFQGRPLNVIKVGVPKNITKPAVWIDAGIHAREWISPATAIYIINSLVTEYNRDAVVTDLLKEFDWFIMPSVNPDGYDYSHTTDRLWRKTRSRLAGSRRDCYGVDANRNFDFRWQSECNGSVRCRGRLPCSDVFAGTRPLSEPETIAVANFILNNRNRIKMYLSFHSYSQLFLLPWGYTKEHPTDYDDLKRLSEKAVDVLKSFYNTSYNIGTPGEILYQATGGSFDWAKGVAGIKYSFTMELRDTGRYGFLLPAHQIQPTGQETWAAVKKLASELKLDTCWMWKRNC